MTVKQNRIQLVSFIFHEAFLPPITHLEQIFAGISNNAKILYCILAGVDKKDELPGVIIIHKHSKRIIARILRYVLLQARLCTAILRGKDHTDRYLFFMESGTLFAILAAKLTGKKVFWMLPSSLEKKLALHNDPVSLLLVPLGKASFALCDKIILYSPNLVNEWQLEPYRHKILIAHRHFLDFNAFTVITPLPDRPLLIGYIGRLSEEKGVQHFAQALPAILNDQQDLRVLIGGDGALKESIEASLQEGGITARVDLPGWISHDVLPNYLNQLRLLVLPSYTEGLPNIMLEAMACGTPVLATPVGAIPDVIIDGKTGFIMENNSPECIAENVIRALNSPDLERIAEDGRRFVEENFTFEKVVENWKRVLRDIS